MNNPLKFIGNSNIARRKSSKLMEFEEYRIRARSLTIELHHLIRCNQGDEVEADAIREQIMNLGDYLSSTDRRRMNEFSGDLYELSKDAFYKLKYYDEMDPRLIRIYWKFQFLREGSTSKIQDTVAPNTLRWDAEDKFLSFEIIKSNAVCMKGYIPDYVYNPTSSQAREAINWFLDDVPISISYPPLA